MNRSCLLLILFCTCQFVLADNKGDVSSSDGETHVCEKTPKTPKFSRMRCDKMMGHQLECKVRCKKGYIRENGMREKTYFCDGYEGGWHDYPTEDCQRKCEPHCENHGKCSNGHCVCTPEYRGNACQYQISACENPEKAKTNILHCNHTSSKSLCTVTCAEGMQFVSPPIDVYECSLKGIWTPNLPPSCEPMNVIHPPTVEVYSVETLMIAEEQRFQRSSGVCAAWGRYHYRTFDGKIYSFDGTCTYLIAKDRLSSSFNIHASTNPECDKGTYCTRRITVYTGDERYDIGEQNGILAIKYQESQLEIPGASGSLQYEWLGQYLVVRSTLGFSLKWDGRQTILLSLKDRLKNNTYGLCGQYDGSASNDFEVLGSSKIMDHAAAFADSWKMPKIGETCTMRNHMGCTYKTSEESAIAEVAAKACYTIYDDAYVACHKILDPTLYFDACKIEFCGCGGEETSCICDTLAEYFRECVRLGGKIHGGWRRNICPLDCPPGMEYTDCGSSCPKTCKQTQYECENEHCVDGCHCRDGTLFHNGKCIPEAKCPCIRGDHEFLSGAKVSDDCNQCECLGGKWECTEEVCHSRCTSTGDAHYKTFDGYKYQFKGECSYYLVYHKNFTIIQDSSLCTVSGLSKKPSSCKKSIIIDAYSTNIILKRDMEVILNGQEINKFPFVNKDIKLQKTSSAVLVDITKGVSLTWDGTNNIYIDAPAFLIGTTQGLCGTFNHKTRDDFTTPDGAIEAQVDNFAEKWKTAIECEEQITLLEMDDPCETYKEKEVDAHKLCNILKSNVFKGCHSEEDVTPFYKDCLYDMCTCREEIKDCLCPVLSNYAAACTKKGFPILWRQEAKECEIECSGGQIYQECANPCLYSCKSLSLEECDEKCVEGCACPEGTALAPDGVCIPISQCPCFHQEKEYGPGLKRKANGQLLCECSNGHWKCDAFNGTEDEMMAVQAVSCQAEKNMVYNDCIKCSETCHNYLLQPKCETSVCRSGCSCMEGYVLDTDTDSCVNVEDCGCWHGGNRFPEGSTHKRDCNNCTCHRGKWECENKECPGTCNSWGEIHVKTFDGNHFDFQGSCEYILVKGTSFDGTIFQIVMETKICGSSGITCTKGIKLQLGNEVKLLMSRDEDLPKPSYDSPFIVRKVGLLVYVYMKQGVMVVWDKGTRISVHAEPKWKGKLSGLCGNFNDDHADDFKTPANGPTEARPRYFVDSWKLNAACPFPEDVKDICAINSHRKSWAKTRCSVLKSDLFKPCHQFVPVDPFYERCVFDTCGCDFGGDCECLCAALAAYSEQCGIQGILIAWRSQELCPIQCIECGIYKPCISTCPKETCETKFMYNEIKKVCNNEPCVEGCEPEPCPSGQIYNNDRYFKCIPEIDCEVPCKIINGRTYVEGERIMDNSVIDACQTCHCQRGKIVCTGKPCRNKTFCESTGWSQWMNSPSTASGDYERIADPSLQKIYFERCTPEYITKIECRTTYTNIPSEHSGQKVICELPDGLICNDEEQEDGQCKDYEIRVFCQCEFSTEGITVASTEITPGKSICVAPGWTAWMKVDVSTHTEEELITNLRKYYTFCPEHEIEKAECRTSSTKLHSGFEVNVKCTKHGMTCTSDIKGVTCPNYEIRFYCRCEGTACAHKRGMETGIISDSQITAKSVLKKGGTEAYYARLNGKQAWTAKSQSESEWIQVDLGELQQVTGVITQGNPNAPQWVEKYTVYYSVDGLEFINLYDSNGNQMVFPGNEDQDTEVTNLFSSPLRARYIRIYPHQWHGAVTLRMELLGCNVYVSTSTVVPSTTSHICIPGWTDFINTDSPRIGEEDYEKVEDIVKMHGICTGGEISDIECKAFVDGQRVHYNNTGDFGVICKTSRGSYCSNYQQLPGRQCRDYSIRLYCSCENIIAPTTTTALPGTLPERIPQACGWTDWLNMDKPKSYKGDKGDMEFLDILQKYYGLCQKPELKYIECRVASTRHDWTESLQNGLKCDTDVGFVCYNRLQASACYDYEVRAYCLYEWCPQSSTISTTLSTISTVSTESPCSPNEYYDECAYKCGQVCLGYLSKLYEVGKCQGEDNNCIATCRPKINCDYPLLWKDPLTCVEKSECSCVMPNGREIEPREVANNNDCERCKCSDNSLNCWTDEACRSTPPAGFFNFTGPCSPNEYYDVCAYKCDQLCMGYLSKLQAIGKCEGEGGSCIASCRPKINCEYPLLWRDPYTCVEKSECSCLISSGREIEPREVASNGPCEQCECYDNKLKCMIDEVCSSTTPGGQMFSTEIPRPCSPDEYYDVCAYKCDQVCVGYLSKLQAVGKCEGEGDGCIATCRPKINCEYPFLWRDPYTCVEKSECTCLISSGREIEPGEVLNNGPCEQCECYENKLKCMIDEVCSSTTPGGQMFSTEIPTLCFDGTQEKYFDIAIEGISVSSQGLLSGKDRIYLNTLSSNKGTGAWSPNAADKNQYVQIDFGSLQYISAITTQGENGYKNWVTKYTVSYSSDGEEWKELKDGHHTKVFRGNYDSDTPVTNTFQNMIIARYIRIVPVGWHNWIAMRLGVKGCPYVSELTTMMTAAIKNQSVTEPLPRECSKPMLFPIDEVSTSLITVSSAESEFSGTSRIKINTEVGSDGTGGWKAAVNDKNQFVLVTFQENRNLHGIVTQGQADEDNWVTSYAIECSIDNVNWYSISDEETGHIFRGNSDRNSLAIQWFKDIAVARYVKIKPITFHGAIAMRLEILGCYEISEISTAQSTLSPVDYCPELPISSRINCPYCTSEFVCDGRNCIPQNKCPCYMEGGKYKVGSKFETSDCQECVCTMFGKSLCMEKNCMLCPLNQRSVLRDDCQCECEECPEGTVYCPSDNQCIQEEKWCDGKIDCADDEVKCEFTTPTVITSSTTVQPKMCIHTQNESIATCELNTGFVNTFDGVAYELNVCDHVLFREKYSQMYDVKVHTECSETSGVCRRYIVIDIDNFVIKIGPNPNRIEFNGIKVPNTHLHQLSKRYKEFSIRNEGTFLTFVSFKYGFKVIWDTHNIVKIKVSDCLLTEVNGLCGFYDGVKENEFQKPDGTIAETEDSFIKSWSINSSGHCIHFVCDTYMKLAADRICSSIEELIFEDCSRALDMKRQKEICLAFACECLVNNYTSSDCTCQILENFLHSCEEKIEIANNAWRVEFSCVRQCPPGLEWNDCGPSCELTCDNFRERNLDCAKTCTPGCFCPSGLVRKGERCVDAKHCHDCVCIGYGDPNFQTFDHQSYAFQGNCTYTLVQHHGDYGSDLEVYVTNTECPLEPGTTCATELKLVYNNNIIIISRDQPVRFNQQILDDIAYNFYKNGINITATKEHTVVYIAEINLLVHYIVPNYGFAIKLPSKLFYNQTAGLCGICNFNPYDDYYHKNGYVSVNVNDFVYSWLVNGSQETCTLIEIPPSPPGDLCKFIKESECEVYVDPTPYIKACENDVSYSLNVNSSICKTLLQYATSCCEYGVILDDLIQSFGCEIQCPQGLIYQCKSPCHLTCSNYKEDEIDCAIEPEYMCSCPGDLIMKDGECVDPVYCAVCDDEGHKVGETWNVNLCETCECLANLKVICQNIICSTVTSCPEGTTLHMISNGTCCDEYECQIEKETPCPTPFIPTCQTGARPQLITTKRCPEYQCECDLSLCSSLKNISHLEPGEEDDIQQNGCCLEQIIRCVPENCPPQKICDIGSKLIEREGKCCTLHDCAPVEKCVYKHHTLLDGFVNESSEAEGIIKLYEPGETWNDGLCKTCRCDKDDEKFVHHCETIKCVEPSYVTNPREYTYEEKEVPGSCCPEYVRTACESNGTIYKVGDEWPLMYGDKCNLYKCTLGEYGEIKKVLNTITCNKNCPIYAKYVEPSPESSDCCGHCEPFGCEDHDKIYMVGEIWVPHSNKCTQAECVKQDGKIEKIITGKQCSLISPFCPDEHKIMDESGCCQLCRIEPGACEVRSIPAKDSTYYFNLNDKVHGVCFNTEPVEHLTECSGSCHSRVVYSSSLDLFAIKCHCCTARESISRYITLQCTKDNITIVKEYKQPRVCECTSCSEEKEKFDFNLEVPKPVK